MKDLIAKLHSDSADQILATFATLEMQLQGFAKSSYEKDLRIAELEAQIADKAALVVERQTWSHITPRDFVEVATAIMDQHGLMDDLSYEKTEKLCEDMEASFKKLPHPVQANTDKLREALKLAVRQNSCDMLMTGEEIRKCEAALNSTALQAPVREVPEGWVSVNDRLPAIGSQVIAYRPTAESTHDDAVMLTRYSGVERISWQGISHGFECICHPSHWMPLPAAPVQEPKP